MDVRSVPIPGSDAHRLVDQLAEARTAPAVSTSHVRLRFSLRHHVPFVVAPRCLSHQSWAHPLLTR